jgi:hypothetical protein
LIQRTFDEADASVWSGWRRNTGGGDLGVTRLSVDPADPSRVAPPRVHITRFADTSTETISDGNAMPDGDPVHAAPIRRCDQNESAPACRSARVAARSFVHAFSCARAKRAPRIVSHSVRRHRLSSD